MQIKTGELTGAALDWAVAKCEALIGLNQGFTVIDGAPHVIGRQGAKGGLSRAEYSHQWHEGGPIIEREEIGLNAENGEWYADCYNPRDIVHCQCYGPTPLIAAMRCYVASKLGDEIDVPDALV